MPVVENPTRPLWVIAQQLIHIRTYLVHIGAILGNTLEQHWVLPCRIYSRMLHSSHPDLPEHGTWRNVEDSDVSINGHPSAFHRWRTWRLYSRFRSYFRLFIPIMQMNWRIVRLYTRLCYAYGFTALIISFGIVYGLIVWMEWHSVPWLRAWLRICCRAMMLFIYMYAYMYIGFYLGNPSILSYLYMYDILYTYTIHLYYHCREDFDGTLSKPPDNKSY